MVANRAATWTRGDFLGTCRALLHATCKENHGIGPQTQPDTIHPCWEQARSWKDAVLCLPQLLPGWWGASASVPCWCLPSSAAGFMEKLKCQNILFVLGIKSHDHWPVMLLPFLSFSLPFSLQPPVPTPPHTDVPTLLQSGRALNRKRKVLCLIKAFIFSWYLAAARQIAQIKLTEIFSFGKMFLLILIAFDENSDCRNTLSCNLCLHAGKYRRVSGRHVCFCHAHWSSIILLGPSNRH